jgi:hypothetical protein
MYELLLDRGRSVVGCAMSMEGLASLRGRADGSDICCSEAVSCI